MCEFIFISFTSDDHKKTFTENNGTSFEFKLDRDFQFENDRWTVTLISFYNKKLSHEDSYIICLDGAIQSVTGENRMLPCLARFPKLSSENQQHLSIPLARDYFDRLSIFINAEESLLKRCRGHISTIQLLFRRQ